MTTSASQNQSTRSEARMLSARDQLILMAKEDFGISYGLNFSLPEEVEYTRKNIGTVKVKVYNETPAGELILRNLAIRGHERLQEKQTSFMFENAAELFAEFPAEFPTFEEAYASLSTIPDAAMKNPQLMLKYRDIRRQADTNISEYVESMRLLSDLIFCFFLALHTDEEWELEKLYSLGEKTKAELTEFMSEQIGLKTLVEEIPEEATKESAETSEEAVPKGKSTKTGG
jgi:hypothetical protein